MATEILSTADSARCDRFAVENGVSSQALMQRAGEAVSDAIRARWSMRPVLVLAGPGNNGGDGFIAAAALRDAGWPVRVMLLGDEARLGGDALWARSVWKTGLVTDSPDTSLKGGLVVDALFGAGLSRPLSGEAAAWCKALDEASVPVVSVDLPSGMNGDAVPVDGPCVAPDLTVTFHRRKLAHLIDPYAEKCGEVLLCDIGIPDGWASSVPPIARQTRAPVWPSAGAQTDPVAHKHRRGRVAVFSGGASASGAARLAARAALRAGAGLVTVCSPPSASLVNASRLDAIMLTRWSGGEDTARVLIDLRAQAAVLGPAMGLGEATRDSVLAALATGLPVVLDADALTSFEGAPEALFEVLHARCVLTPHAGEFARLFGREDPSQNRLDQVGAAADRAGCTVLLKGPATLIATPGQLPWINRHASPWLATAGSGDVLAGMVAAGLSAGLSPHDSAAGAAWLHGDAGRRLGPGLIAEDLPEILPQVLQAVIARHRRESALTHLLAHGS